MLRTYVEEGIPSCTGLTWSPQALGTAISNGPYALACTPKIITLIRGEMQRRIKDGFSILLPATSAIRLFG